MARFIGGLAAVAVLALAPTAQATSLPPGGTVAGPGTIVPTYVGTVSDVVPFQNSTFNFNGNVGFVSSAVVPASGGLDFVYQVNVSVGQITGLAISSFGNTTTNVSQTSDNTNLHNTNQFFPGNVSVATYDRSAGTGNTIDVAFSGSGVTNSQASFLIIVHTNSPTFALSQLKVNSMGNFLSVQTLAPVPEPGTIFLWAGTLGGFVCFIGWEKLRKRYGAQSGWIG